MTHVATLISNPSARSLDKQVLERAQTVLNHDSAPHWLAPGIAADISFTPQAESNNRAIADQVRSAIADYPIDVVVQAKVDRRKRLLVADMDSTMIGQECIDELADHVGLKSHVAAITERAMRGEIEFEPALRERVALLKGLPVSVIDEIITNRIELTPGGPELVRTMRAHGAYTCLVSGGFTLFTGRIANAIGFDIHLANRLIIENGHLGGQVQEPILGREAKLATLCHLTEHLKLGTMETLAVGDGANDLAMLQHAGLGIAFRAKPTVAAAAHARIEHGDLTALLYMQGYRIQQFVNR